MLLDVVPGIVTVTPWCFCLLLCQVGTGDRSEKIKTYNYKDSRCSDHRLKQNYDLNKVLDGEIEDGIQVTAMPG
jgi:hypothetical protein